MDKKQYYKMEKMLSKAGEPMDDWAYLVHHAHVDSETGKEVLHHCFMLDHLGNKYEVKHMIGKDSKFYHVIVGLQPEQEVYWSDEDAREGGEKVPCANRQLESPR